MLKHVSCLGGSPIVAKIAFHTQMKLESKEQKQRILFLAIKEKAEAQQ